MDDVVKVQISLRSTGPKKRVLIYNEDRSIESEMDAPDEIVELMGDRLKAYFHCTFEDGNLEIREEAPWCEF